MILTHCWCDIHMYLSSLFIDNKFHGHLILSPIKRLVAEWWERWTCNLEAVRGVAGSNPTADKIFCNVRLFRVPRSWTGSVQMKSSMTFIRGNRCIEREKDNFKSHEVKRLKECALALREKVLNVLYQVCVFMSIHQQSGSCMALRYTALGPLS